MNFSKGLIAATGLALAAVPAAAQDSGRDFCADRPGFGTPTCTLAPGEAMIELGLAGWERASDAATREDSIATGDVLLRVGVAEAMEVQIGFGGYGRTRSRDRMTGLVTRDSGVGDILLAARHGLAGPNGPVAVQAYVTLPVGTSPVGAGDWGAGVLLPIEFDLGAGLGLALTPEVSAAVDGDGNGRHIAYGGTIGLSGEIAPGIGVSGEVLLIRDNDPLGHATDARGAVAAAWQVAADWQIDAEVDIGLSAAAPDHALIVGIAHRFR